MSRRLSAGVVVVRFDDGPKYLLLRAFGYWDFPKGLVGAGETPRQAAVREVGEEAGLSDLRFRWGEEYYETERYSGGKIARYYLAESPAGEAAYLPVSPELGRPEHHELRWLEYEAARRRLGTRVRGALDWAHARVAGDRVEDR